MITAFTTHAHALYKHDVLSAIAEGIRKDLRSKKYLHHAHHSVVNRCDVRCDQNVNLHICTMFELRRKYQLNPPNTVI